MSSRDPLCGVGAPGTETRAKPSLATITVFKSVGIAAEDRATAVHVEAAREVPRRAKRSASGHQRTK